MDSTQDTSKYAQGVSHAHFWKVFSIQNINTFTGLGIQYITSSSTGLCIQYITSSSTGLSIQYITSTITGLCIVRKVFSVNHSFLFGKPRLQTKIIQDDYFFSVIPTKTCSNKNVLHTKSKQQ